MSMATELTEIAALAAENVLRERHNDSLQTSLDDWSDRLELERALNEAIIEVDILNEPRDWVDVVSFGENQVLGFLVKKGRTEERTIFS